ncbi:MAG: transcription termination factor NusA [Candidatus Krumholzibacteria bacterium]|nr:transcription termination factor NusA [Candidatus Krumholzibacteria bacterium]
MSDGFFDALVQITRERKVDRETLLEALIFSLRSAVRRKHGSEAEVDVEISPEKGEIEVHLVKRVVTEEDLIEEDQELTVDEAEEFVDNPEPGDVIRIPLEVSEFGRNAIHIAKQVLVQGVKDAERENIFNEYSGRVGEIITGTVQQIDRGSILINLGRTEALLPWREQIRRERFHQSETIRGLVLEVHRESKGPQIILSRTHPDLLARLFEQEIPEVYEGLVELKGIAREPGWRSKVAVHSHDERVDAVGACVGMKGARVMAIVKELSGERIDIVPWDEDVATYVSRALSPAQVSAIRILDWDNREMQVIVEDDQLSLAIGREGQNVRLAARLTGWNLDLVTSTILKIREQAAEEIPFVLSELPGVTDKLLEVMKEAGIESVAKIVKLGPDALQELPGVGEVKAQALFDNALVEDERIVKARKDFIDKELKAHEERAQEARDAEEAQIFKEDAFSENEEEPAESEEVDASTLTFSEVDDSGEEAESQEEAAADPVEVQQEDAPSEEESVEAAETGSESGDA